MTCAPYPGAARAKVQGLWGHPCFSALGIVWGMRAAAPAIGSVMIQPRSFAKATL